MGIFDELFTTGRDTPTQIALAQAANEAAEHAGLPTSIKDLTDSIGGDNPTSDVRRATSGSSANASPNIFTEEVEKKSSSTMWLWIAGGVVLLVVWLTSKEGKK